MITLPENHLRQDKPLNVQADILDCSRIVDDIALLNQAVQDQGIDTDSIANILLGLEYLYTLKFQRLNENFQKSLNNKE